MNLFDRPPSITVVKAIRKAEREKVLGELENFIDVNSVLIYDEEAEESDNWVSLGEIRAKIEEMWQEGKDGG